jgi:hypothetical protein
MRTRCTKDRFPPGYPTNKCARYVPAIWQVHPNRGRTLHKASASGMRRSRLFTGTTRSCFAFEHDLFDQLLLIRHLAWFQRQSLGSTRLALICVGTYPGIEPFMGLGQLNPDQFASLFETRAAITPEQMELGQRAWEAFTSPDPHRLVQLLATDTSSLPFLAHALRRHLQEFPATGTGLPRTEREILEILVNGPQSPATLFRAEQRRESCFFIGDSSFRWRLDVLAALPRPLITIQLDSKDNRILPPGVVMISDTGRDVLAGRTDWLEVRDLDRWLGGVHVRRGSMWRWNADGGHIEKV